jgi:hypothetical protein
MLIDAAHPRFRLEASVPEVMARAENVVVIAWRKRDVQKLWIEDFAGGTASEECTFEQIFLTALSSRRDFRRRLDRRLVFEQTLQHTDCGVKGRARTLQRLAIPTAVIELLAEEAE